MSDSKVVGTGAAAGAPRVGVVGGGQLARMMQEAAIALGIELRALVEAPDGATGQVVPLSVVGAADDADAVLALARGVDAVTVEHEHVPDEILAAAADIAPVRPGASALAFAQDKLLMRRRLTEAGIECPRWFAARNDEEIASALRELGGRAVVKTPRDGYDGKGVAEIRLAPDGRCETSAPLGQWLDAAGGEGLLIEELVPFTCEISQLVARRPGGEIASWCAVETIQRGGVCAETIAPARVSSNVAGRAADIAKAVAEELGVLGMLAVEMFVDGAGRILVNELAMRPHNSGHWTQDGAVTSQFAQHLRAVLDLPLGSTALTAPATVMVNHIGARAEPGPDALARALAADAQAHVHLYGKGWRPGRKLGHVNITCPGTGPADIEQALARARAVVAALGGRS